jgi:predicted nucleic acid-binding protein
MKMSKAQDINGYRFSKTDKLFFDANIWLYVYGPQGNPGDAKVRMYSSALANAIRAGSLILADVLVVSEFINRFARLEHQALYLTGKAPQDFKQFRNSPDFQPIAQAIVAAVRKILKLAARTESGFASVDINALLTEFEGGGYDFNDQILVRLCLSQNLKLVTHDRDFKRTSVNILTANRYILTP